MPDFTKSPWREIVVFLGVDGAALTHIFIVLVVAALAMRLAGIFVHGIVKALLDREATEGTAQELSALEITKRMGTLDALATNVLRFFIFLIAVVTILDALQLNIGPAVAGLGIIGVALGFGAQSLVKDYLNGALVLIENQYSKGDVVRIGGVSGTVEDFSLRRTTLRDIDGIVHTVPNGEITVASNLTRVWARINQDIVVAYGTDIERAIQVVDNVGREMAGDPDWKRRVLEAPRVERVEALGEYGITLKVLGSVRAADRWSAGGELRKRLLAAFHEHGIEIPRPQRVVLAREMAGIGGPGAAGTPTADAAADAPPGLPVGPGPDQDELSDGAE